MGNERVPRSKEKDSRRQPFSDEFKKFIVKGWGDDVDGYVERLEAADWAVARRRRAVAEFPDTTLVVPAGPLKVRSNDTDYRFRPHTAFAWLTGLGEDREPGAALVLTAKGEARLYFRPRAPRTDEEFYANARYGEMWVGRRNSLAEMERLTGIESRDIRNLASDLADAGSLLVVRDADPEITALVDGARGRIEETGDSLLASRLSEFRLTKDDFEISEMRTAIEATRVGFEAVARELPNAVANRRGERWVEGIFALHARHLGNAVGYETIAAGGDNATVLHWIRNHGDLNESDLLLLDAGVEVSSLHTADVTRTLPVSGKFSPAQRRVYDVVLAAQSAGIEACRPGAPFLAPHEAAVRVIAEFLADIGILPCSVEESLSPEGGQHRRWMVHGTSHHLGMDVHDCALARSEAYRQGDLASGMIITVEPGIYFKSTDLLVPEEFRGIGIRIEDDILITADGHENLSVSLPRAADDVEAWLAAAR